MELKEIVRYMLAICFIILVVYVLTSPAVLGKMTDFQIAIIAIIAVGAIIYFAIKNIKLKDMMAKDMSIHECKVKLFEEGLNGNSDMPGIMLDGKMLFQPNSDIETHIGDCFYMRWHDPTEGKTKHSVLDMTNSKEITKLRGFKIRQEPADAVQDVTQLLEQIRSGKSRAPLSVGPATIREVIHEREKEAESAENGKKTGFAQ